MLKEYENISLREYNSFHIDARCERLVEYSCAEDLREVFAGGRLNGRRWNVLSGGNNILFTSDYEGTLLHPADRSIEVITETPSLVRVRVGAAVEWDDFVEWCVRRQLWGVENLSKIPGYVGAAPVQNIGAYGAEVAGAIESVETFAVDSLSTLVLSREHCGFGYRESVFKGILKGKAIITSVVFALGKLPSPNIGYGDLNDKVRQLGGPSLENIREAVTVIRASKLPDTSQLGNAGSFFRNPIVAEQKGRDLKEEFPAMPLYPCAEAGFSKLAAGWLIEAAGWKGRRIGNVGVHEKQALVLVNYGGASGAEVLDLAARVTESVYEDFGVRLTPEVNIL